MTKSKILFCHTGRSSFVISDLKILESDYEVFEYQYKPSGHWAGKFLNLVQSGFIAIKYVSRVDIVYSFFAGFHCFFPFILAKILKTKTVVVIGGYDAVSVPVIKYGIFYKRNLLSFCTKIIFRFADYLLPVHNSLIMSHNQYLSNEDKNAKVGISHFVAQVNGKIADVPTGYDPEVFKRNVSITRKAGVLSVASIEKEQDFIRKGFDFIFEAAGKMPEVEFVLAGFNEKMLNKLKRTKPRNLKLKGFLPKEELIDLYSEYKIFLQPSLCEGLPNTLCEAMLCECIPIGSAVCGIPDVIHDTGYIIKSKDITELIKSVESALSDEGSFGLSARQRIINEFSFSKRQQTINDIFDHCLNTQGNF